MLATLPAAGQKIAFLDVGQGDCILVQCPGASKQYVLVDCGTSLYHEEELGHFKKFFQALKEQIKAVVITHGDTDHYSIVSALLREGLAPNLMVVGGAFTDYSKRFRDRIEIFNKAKRRAGAPELLNHKLQVPPGAWVLPNDFTEPETNSVVSCQSKQMEFQVLAANYKQTDKNGRSIVLKLTYHPKPSPGAGGSSPSTSAASSLAQTVNVYLMGDAEKATEDFIVEKSKSTDVEMKDAPPLAPDSDRNMAPGGPSRRAKPPALKDTPKPEEHREERRKKSEAAGRARRESVVMEKRDDCRSPKPVEAPKDKVYVVLKVGHHGSQNGTSEGWLSHIRKPSDTLDAAIISAGGTKYGHPRCEVLERLDPGGKCNSKSTARTIRCYAQQGGAGILFGLNSSVVHSTHLNEGKGVHWLFDLDKPNWQGYKTLDDLKAALFTP